MKKHVVITGGSRGIGLCTACKFLDNGFDVTILSRSKVKVLESIHVLENRRKSLKSELAIRAFVCDVSQPRMLEESFKQIYTASSGRIDVLVNSAALSIDNLLLKADEDQIRRQIDTNLIGSMLACKLALRKMVKQKSGSIVNVGSVVGLTGNAGQTVYAATKAGLIGFTKSLAKEIASKGITANIVAPGFVDTEFVTPEQKEKIGERIPLNRLASPEEIAEAIYFVSEAKYITGQVLVVDGGLSINV